MQGLPLGFDGPQPVQLQPGWKAGIDRGDLHMIVPMDPHGWKFMLPPK